MRDERTVLVNLTRCRGEIPQVKLWYEMVVARQGHTQTLSSVVKKNEIGAALQFLKHDLT